MCIEVRKVLSLLSFRRVSQTPLSRVTSKVQCDIFLDLSYDSVMKHSCRWSLHGGVPLKTPFESL